MSDATVRAIIANLNRVRRLGYPNHCQEHPEAVEIEQLDADHVAALAAVVQWGHRPLDDKVGAWTPRELMAQLSGLTGRGELERVLAELAASDLIELRKESHFFSSKVSPAWSRRGADVCYAYLNSWGWELLCIVLDQRNVSDFASGPPIVGGPGTSGWSSSDR